MSTASEKPAWAIRAYQPGDERDLVALFQRVFGKPITEAHWRWKLKQRPSPVENVWLAMHDGKPIFQYAGIPTRFRLPTGDRIAMVSVDTMTAPEFRRRGLLTTVGTFTYDTWRKAGVPFVLGLPNEPWGSRIQAMHWESLFPLQWLLRPLRLEAILGRRVRVPALSRLAVVSAAWNRYWERSTRRGEGLVQIRRVAQAGPEFDVLWQHCRVDAEVSVIRDSAWVNWRYVQAPGLDYCVLLAERSGQPAGYTVYRVQQIGGQRLGLIAELLVPRGDAAACSALMGAAVAHLRAAGAESAVTLAVPNTWIYQMFQHTGFVFRRASFVVRLVPLDPALPMDLLRNPQSWSMSGGDFDVV